MKLHLPTRLCCALIACTAASAYAADLEWSGKTEQFANGWYTAGTTNAATFAEGDNLSFGTNTGVADVKTGKNLTYAAGTIDVDGSYRFDVDENTTLSGKFDAADQTITKNWKGTLTLNAGSQVDKLNGDFGAFGTIRINGSAAEKTQVNSMSMTKSGTIYVGAHATVGSISATGSNTVNITGSVGAVTMTNGTLELKNGGSLGDVTGTGSQTIYMNGGGNNGASNTRTYTGTVTIKNGETTIASFTAKDNAQYNNAKFAGYTQLTRDGGQAQLNNIDAVIAANYQLNNVKLTGSTLTINAGVCVSNNTGETSFDNLIIKEGGRLQTSGSGTFTYTGSIQLTLDDSSFAPATVSDTLTSLSTSVLPGTMNAGSSLSLNFAEGMTALPISGTTFSLTLDALNSSATGYDMESFKITGLTGWELTSVAAAASGTGTTLTFTSNKAVPEPTTATLSLLALAGLAARRRRK